jgi:hypothetical protein
MPLRTHLRSVFGLDLRSLALLRMALAALILWDLALAAEHLRAFYTDEGILPRYLVFGGHLPLFRLHLLSGAAWFEGLLFAVEAACAAALLLGWRTRIATVLCFVLLVSRQTRNELVLFGPDMVLRVILFWAMFLPLAKRWSLDAARGGREAKPSGERWLGVAGVSYLVQFSLVYVINGLMKTGPAWQTDHTAVARALTLDIYSRPPGVWLNQFDGLTMALTVATLWIEIWGCLLLVLPMWNGWGRLLGCLLLGALQIGFNVTMDLGLFGPVMLGAMVGFLPAEFWDRLVAPMVRRLAPVRGGTDGAPAPASNLPPASPVPPRGWPTRLAALARDCALLYLLAIVVAANLNGLPQRAGRAPLLLPGGHRLMVAVGLDQRFDMFAPDPQTDDGWFVMRGTLANGETADVFSGARPATLDKPPSVVATYCGQRWGAVLIAVGYPGADSHLAALARHLGEEWNRTHAADERLTMLEIIVMSQYVDQPHHQTEPEAVLLWTQYF